MFKVLSVVALLMFGQVSLADSLTEEKKRVIDEMLELTGALDIAEMMGNAMSNQMLDALARQGGNFGTRETEVLKDEVNKIMYDEFIASRFMHEMSYTIYHKHFTTAELKEIAAFYKTPTGRKMSALLPQITQEGMIAGQRHAMSLGPVIQQRLAARFEKEGIQ